MENNNTKTGALIGAGTPDRTSLAQANENRLKLGLPPMWYWKQTNYNEYTLINQRSGKSKVFGNYKALFDYCQIHCINAQQV